MMHLLIEFLQSQRTFGKRVSPSCQSLVFYLYTYCLALDLGYVWRTAFLKDLKAFPTGKCRAFEGGGRVDRILRHCLADHKDPKETRRRFEQIRIADPLIYVAAFAFFWFWPAPLPHWATWHGDRYAANLRWAEHAGQL